MSEKKFFIAKNGKQEGPYFLEEIRTQLNAGQLQPTDYIYDEVQADWVFILDLSRFTNRDGGTNHGSSSEQDGNEKPQEIVALECESPDVDWYILKGDDKFGPFSFMDVINLLQEKSIFEFDFVWNHYLPSWQRLAELESFAPHRLQHIAKNNTQVQDTLFRRKHRRLNHGRSILVHNNQRVWKGQSVDVSSGGARVMLKESNLEVGEMIYLHVKSGDNVPPFNAICEVVNKKAEMGEADTQTFFYGLKFKSIGKSEPPESSSPNKIAG